MDIKSVSIKANVNAGATMWRWCVVVQTMKGIKLPKYESFHGYAVSYPEYRTYCDVWWRGI